MARNIVGRIESIQDRAVLTEGFGAADRLPSAHVTHVLIEDFRLRMFSMDPNLLTPVRMTSAILSFLEMSETLIVEVVFQSPSDKSIITNEMLRKRGMWHVGGGGHANDASRHLLTYLRKHRGWR